MSGSSEPAAPRGPRFAPLLLAAVAGLAAVGCAVPPQPRDPSICAPLFVQYDRYVLFAPPDLYEGPPRSTVGLPYLRWRQGLLLIQNGCRTRPEDIAGLGARPAARPVVQSGAALPRPVAVHAGVVTGDAAAAEAEAYFRSLGLRATSVGDPQLGRRLYIGPATTQGGLEEIIARAFDAGFVAPYPSSIFRF